jgi:Family of unknown function (DUF6527)
MKKTVSVRHQFVANIPAKLDFGVLYVSMEYATVVHLCCCGCGNEVVTPLGPTDWSVIFDGQSLSLRPSVGNWSFRCKSHYWIDKGRVRWAGLMSDDKIAEGRVRDRIRKDEHFEADALDEVATEDEMAPEFARPLATGMTKSKQGTRFWFFWRRK